MILVTDCCEDGAELRKQKQEHERDAQKEQQLLKMLPDGFLYELRGG